MTSYTSPSPSSSYTVAPVSYPAAAIAPTPASEQRERWFVFAVAVFLVSVPVFVQAPIVRFLPWISLAVTPLLFALAGRLLKQTQTQLWGDLLVGFTWTWLSGSVYWGWLRWEPLVHLPIEAIGLPFAIWGLARGWSKVGNLFYMGSLFGTVVTDVYFYVVGLIPHWRSLMRVEGEAVRPIFQSAIAQVETPWGIAWAVSLALLLLSVGLLPLRSRQSYWWAFSGAVMSTVLVDGLFWLAAISA